MPKKLGGEVGVVAADETGAFNAAGLGAGRFEEEQGGGVDATIGRVEVGDGVACVVSDPMDEPGERSDVRIF